MELQFVGFLEARLGFPLEKKPSVKILFKFRKNKQYLLEISFVLSIVCFDTALNSGVLESCRHFSEQSFLLNSSMYQQSVLFWKQNK